MKVQHHLRRFLFVILLIALFLSACTSSKGTTAATTNGTVKSIMVTDLIETSGNLSAGRLAQLKWSTTGQIESVSVKVGDKVKKDQILATLKADSVPSEVITAQANLALAKQELDNLTKSGLTLAEAVSAVITARVDVEEAENTYNGLDYPRASDVVLKDYQVKIWDAEKQSALMYGKYKEVERHPDGDPEKMTAMQNYVTAKQNYDSLVATYNYLTAKATPEDYEEAKANLDVARAKLEDARRQRDLVKNGADPLTLQSANAKVNSAQAAVNALYAIAPFDGDVIAVQAIVGNTASKDGNAIVVVDKSTLQIDTLVDETGIAAVQVGNTAEVTMDSLEGVILTGKVSLINPIGVVVNGLVKYTVTVSLDPTSEPVLFGSTTSVVIKTGEPHSELAVPLNAVMSDNTSEYVLVVTGGSGDKQTTRRVDVVSGTLVDSMVVIKTTGDLKADDVVVETTTSSSSDSGVGGGPGGFMGPGGG